tara:strand:+ start:5197 stop:5649 length:453 start_codon:yes stop_codon:yes gene_type:complete
MYDEVELRKALRARLQTASGLPSSSNFAWENRVFVPPSHDSTAPVDAVVWLRENLRTLSESKSSNGFVETIGEYLISVFTAKGRGTNAADTLVKSIATQFAPGQSLTGTDIAIALERTSRSEYRASDEHPAWVFKVVTVRWRVFTPSTTN